MTKNKHGNTSCKPPSGTYLNLSDWLSEDFDLLTLHLFNAVIPKSDTPDAEAPKASGFKGQP